MSKVTADQIIARGFTREMFRKGSDEDLTAMVQTVIAEQSTDLQGLIGSALYAATESPTEQIVTRAELCLVLSEMYDRRINAMLEMVSDEGREIPTRAVERQREKYADEAAEHISNLSSADVTTGISASSHFDADIVSASSPNYGWRFFG